MRYKFEEEEPEKTEETEEKELEEDEWWHSFKNFFFPFFLKFSGRLRIGQAYFSEAAESPALQSLGSLLQLCSNEYACADLRRKII